MSSDASLTAVSILVAGSKREREDAVSDDARPTGSGIEDEAWPDRKQARTDFALAPAVDVWAKRDGAPDFVSVRCTGDGVYALKLEIVRLLRLGDVPLDAVSLHVAEDGMPLSAALDSRRRLSEVGVRSGSSIVVRIATLEHAARGERRPLVNATWGTVATALHDVGVADDTGYERGTVASSFESLMKPLAFVNRCAEALDVIVPNLSNQESLRCGDDVKFETPLASQPSGTGKTALGRNLTAILRRPRDADATAEVVIAEKLKGAWCWRGGPPVAVETALRDPSDENMVVRTLFALFPHHKETIISLKRVEPLVISMKSIMPPSFGFDFNKAMAYSIFCAALHMPDNASTSWDAFVALHPTQQTEANQRPRCSRGGRP